MTVPDRYCRTSPEVAALRARRRELELSQAEVARMSGIQSGTLSGYENGVSRPSPEALIKWQTALARPSREERLTARKEKQDAQVRLTAQVRADAKALDTHRLAEIRRLSNIILTQQRDLKALRTDVARLKAREAELVAEVEVVRASARRTGPFSMMGGRTARPPAPGGKPGRVVELVSGDYQGGCSIGGNFMP